MKKYRYDDPNKITRGQRYRAYTVFFIAWNFIGYSIYKYFSKTPAKKDPELENRPQGGFFLITMKKYRYDDPNKITRGQRYRAYTVFFIAWNFIGYSIYKYFSKNPAKKDPELENRPQDEKIELIHGADPKSVKRFSLFGSSEKEKNES